MARPTNPQPKHLMHVTCTRLTSTLCTSAILFACGCANANSKDVSNDAGSDAPTPATDSALSDAGTWSCTSVDLVQWGTNIASPLDAGAVLNCDQLSAVIPAIKLATFNARYAPGCGLPNGDPSDRTCPLAIDPFVAVSPEFMNLLCDLKAGIPTIRFECIVLE